MQNQRVHEYTVETGSNGLPVARLGTVHNLISFSEGPRRFHYYDGKWVNDGGHELDARDIPDHCKTQVRSIPFDPTGGLAGPDTLVNCEFCTYIGPSKEYAKHLASVHVRSAQSDAAVPPSVTQLRPEDLPPGDYETDEFGFVELNPDGSPRKRAGSKKE